MPTPVTLDRRLRLPLHRQVYEQLRRAILSGRLAPGTQLPSTRELSVALLVARTTVTVAYDQLVAEGFLETRAGAGTFVARGLPDRPRSRPIRSDEPRRAESDIRWSAFASRLTPLTRRPAAPTGAVDLSPPAPDPGLFPFAVWARLLRHEVRRLPAHAQATSPMGGLERLRRAIAAYLGRSRAVRCTPDQIVITNGSQAALDLCARVLVEPGDAVALEEPGYAEARDLFAATGALAQAVPVDGDGLRVDRIGAGVRLVHVTPSHQFPLGISMSLARRLELLTWARSAQGVIIEDDYDSEFRYAGAPLPALQGLDEASRVVYVGTFSTAMFRGLRLGYLVLPPALVDSFLSAKRHATGLTPALEQAALAEFIVQGHLERHLRRMRRIYKRRYDALAEALHRELGDRATLVGDAAGLHAVIRVAGLDPSMFPARRVAVETTRTCYAGAGPASELIVRFAAVTERALRDAVSRLARH